MTTLNAFMFGFFINIGLFFLYWCTIKVICLYVKYKNSITLENLFKILNRLLQYFQTNDPVHVLSILKTITKGNIACKSLHNYLKRLEDELEQSDIEIFQDKEWFRKRIIYPSKKRIKAWEKKSSNLDHWNPTEYTKMFKELKVNVNCCIRAIQILRQRKDFENES